MIAELHYTSATDRQVREVVDSHKKTITAIYLDGTRITDISLAAINECACIREISCNYTNISSRGVNSLRDIPELRDLSLGFTLTNDDASSGILRHDRLESLDLSGLSMSDALIRAVGRLHALQSLAIDETCVQNLDLSMISTCNRLASLSLKKVRNTAMTWDWISLFPCLRELSISHARMKSVISNLPPEVRSLDASSSIWTHCDIEKCVTSRYLSHLGCAHSQIEDGDLEILRDAVPESLDVSGNPISNNGIQRLGVSEHTWLVNASETLITDRAVLALAPWPQLQYLDASFTDVTDKCIDIIAEMRGLFFVNLANTSVSAHAVCELAKHPGIKKISMTPASVDDALLVSNAFRGTNISIQYLPRKLRAEVLYG